MSQIITNNLVKNGFHKFRLNKKEYFILKKKLLKKICDKCHWKVFKIRKHYIF